MPKVSRFFVFSALVYLLAALTAGSAITLDNLGVTIPATWSAMATYVHLWAIGWLTQLIFGIGYWLLPTVDKVRGRGSTRPLWVAFWAINIGLPLRILFEPGATPGPPYDLSHLGLALSAVLLWLSGVCFIWNIWPRVR